MAIQRIINERRRPKRIEYIVTSSKFKGGMVTTKSKNVAMQLNKLMPKVW